MRLLALFFLSAGMLTAQSPLTTTFANNNAGSAGGAVYFDLSTAADAVIFDFDLNFTGAAGIASSVTVYTTPNSAFGQEGNMAAWTVHDTATVASTAGAGAPSNCVFDNQPLLVLTGAPIGVAIVCAAPLAHTYTTGGTSFPLVYEECPLTLTCGTASNMPFTGTVFTPRVVNTNIYFVGGDCATVEELGAGCAAPNALALAATSGRPVQGASPVSIDCTTSNIPANALIHVGWIGLTSPGVSLGAIGLPTACSLHASLDLILDVTPGIAGSHAWTAGTLPGLPPSFSGFEFIAQSATLGAGFFDTDGRTSNGLRYVVGSL